MPRKASQPSFAEQSPAPGGAAAVDRALSLLCAFTVGDSALTLAEISTRTALYKSTVLRLLASLEHARFIQRAADGRYRLGPEVARLNAIYQAAFSLEGVVMPVLRELVATTRESAAFHVRQGDARLCLHRVDSPQPVRDAIRVGDLLPLDRGAGGRVLLAFEGAKGARYARIRAEQVALLIGDRVAELAGISAPAFGPAGLVGVVTLTMPSARVQPGQAALVLAAARRLTAALGGVYPEPGKRV